MEREKFEAWYATMNEAPWYEGIQRAIAWNVWQARAALDKDGEPVAWRMVTGHGTSYRENITPELVALEFGGVKMWQPLYAKEQPCD